MSVNDDIKKIGKALLYNKSVGYVFAMAREDVTNSPGDSAFALFNVDDPRFPGISIIEINVNQWDVFSHDNPVALRAAVRYYKDKAEGFIE